jgi:hypothetical protein
VDRQAGAVLRGVVPLRSSLWTLRAYVVHMTVQFQRGVSISGSVCQVARQRLC